MKINVVVQPKVGWEGHFEVWLYQPEDAGEVLYESDDGRDAHLFAAQVRIFLAICQMKKVEG